MAKIIKNNLGNFLVILVIFTLVTGWIFSGWPQIWQKPPIPPKIQEVLAYDVDDLYSFTTQGDANDGSWTYWNTDIGNHSVAAQDTDQYWCWTDTGSVSGSTGPPSGTACIYPETSSPTAVGDEYTAEITDAVDASQYGLFVTFDRCMQGNTAGYMYFEAWDGDSWNTIASWPGDSVTTFVASGPYDFSPTGLNYSNSDFKIRFRVVVGGTSYQNDFTFDEVRIYGDLKNEAPNTPTLAETPAFANMQTNDTTPELGDFSATDPDIDNLEYDIQWDEDYDFGSPVTNNSADYATNGFTAATFASGASVSYIVQAGEALTNGQTYWWRVRARDPSGSNTWTSYSAKRSISIDTSISVARWFQTTGDQFGINTLTDTVTTTDGVKLGGW